MLKQCERTEQDVVGAAIRFDDRSYTLDSLTFVPIYRQQPIISCAYCHAGYSVQSEQQLCSTCKLGRIGAQVINIRD